MLIQLYMVANDLVDLNLYLLVSNAELLLTVTATAIIGPSSLRISSENSLSVHNRSVNPKLGQIKETKISVYNFDRALT